MSLFFDDLPESKPLTRRDRTVSLCHQLECQSCPLNTAEVIHPKMPATGSKRPLWYILGEAPGAEEDQQGVQFVGQAGRRLRQHIPESCADSIRWNNVVRTRPPGNKTPGWKEIESCRPSIIRDIEATKPKAILGFGAIPLNWAVGKSGITDKWRGRRFPIRIGSHVCWFYSIVHPSYIKRIENIRGGIYPEYVRFFGKDIARAFREVPKLPNAVAEDTEKLMDGITLVDGRNGETDVKRVLDTLADLATRKVVSLDYETNGLRPYADGAKILSIAVGTYRKTIAFAIDHSQAKWDKDERNTVWDAYRDFIRNRKFKISAHNSAFEMEWTAFFCGPESLRVTEWHDSMIAMPLLDERNTKGDMFSLEVGSILYLGFNVKAQSALDVKNLDNEPLIPVLRYNAFDCKYQHRLMSILHDRLTLHEGKDLRPLYKEYMRRVPTMVLTQHRGMLTNQKFVVKHADDLARKLEIIDRKLSSSREARLFKKHTGRDLNVQSTKDLVYLFGTLLGHKEVAVEDEWGKTSFTVDANTLGMIGGDFAFAVRDHRELAKIKSTYTDPLNRAGGGEAVWPDNKTHATYNVPFAETGRLTCNDPNMQNIPVRTEEGRKIRQAFVARPGHTLIMGDYGGIDARVVAMFSKDPTLCKRFHERYDIHLHWAKRIAEEHPPFVYNNKKWEADGELRKSARDKAKGDFVFLSLFGGFWGTSAKRLNIPEELAEALQMELWKEFPGVPEWHKQLLKSYERYGYVETLGGRRRRGPLKRNQIFNTPIQGTTAEITIDSTIRLSEQAYPWKPWEDAKVYPNRQPILMVHDDNTLDVPSEKVGFYRHILVKTMLECPFEYAHIVPLSVDVKEGKDLYSMNKVGEFFSDTYQKEAVYV